MDEEELSKRWESFHLTEGETEVIEVTGEELVKSKARGENCLIALLVAEKSVNRDAFRATMSKVWKLEGWVVFKEVGDNRFLIEFQFQQDKDKVMKGRPWFFDRFLMTIQHFDGNVAAQDISFSVEPFWVQVHKVPLAAMNCDIGQRIGRKFGGVHEVDVDHEGIGWGRCLRIRVDVNLSQPLLRGTKLCLDGRTLWLPFKYERLQGFCFKCGILRHDKNVCVTRVTDPGNSHSDQQFGGWLRAQPMNTSFFTAKKYGGDSGSGQRSPPCSSGGDGSAAKVGGGYPVVGFEAPNSGCSKNMVSDSNSVNFGLGEDNVDSFKIQNHDKVVSLDHLIHLNGLMDMNSNPAMMRLGERMGHLNNPIGSVEGLTNNVEVVKERAGISKGKHTTKGDSTVKLGGHPVCAKTHDDMIGHGNPITKNVSTGTKKVTWKRRARGEIGGCRVEVAANEDSKKRGAIQLGYGEAREGQKRCKTSSHPAHCSDQEKLVEAAQQLHQQP